jgi:hypothetical protein
MLDQKQINDIVTIGFQNGLQAGKEVEKHRILAAINELHTHNEHGAIVYLEELQEYLEVLDNEPESDLS